MITTSVRHVLRPQLTLPEGGDTVGQLVRVDNLAAESQTQRTQWEWKLQGEIVLRCDNQRNKHNCRKP